MKSAIRTLHLIAPLLALAFLSACGGGGGVPSTSTPPPPPPPATLTITTSQLPTGVIGKTYSAKLEASGGQGARTWSMTQGPSWLTINSATGELTGTPTEQVWSGIEIKVTDTSNRTATAQFLLAVFRVLEIVPPPGGTLGLEYSGAITTQGGGQPARKLTITGALPPGLTIQLDDYGRGDITGTPTQAGSFTFSVEATDRAEPPQVVKADVTMVIDTHVAITTKELKYAVEGRTYSDTPTVINGTAPFTWSAQSLPYGLAINPSTGEISGTPTFVWYIDPTLTVTDSSNPPQTASRSVRLLVYGKLEYGGSNPVFTSNAGSFYQGLGLGGGVPPLSYSITSGQLPAGLSLSQYGYLSGTVEQGDYEFNVTVQDSASPPQVLERPYALHILPPRLSASWSSGMLARVGKPFSYQFSASSGTPPYRWSMIGALPEGLTLSESGVLSGTPSEEGYFTFTAAVSDSATPTQKLTTIAELHVFPLAPLPNNTIANATPVGWEPIKLSISPYTDENGVAAPDSDYYKILAQGGSTVTTYATVDGPIDPVLELLDQNGVRLKTCNNPDDDNPPSFIVKDPTPSGFDDDCVNDDGSGYYTSSWLSIKVPGNIDTIQTINAHVVDYRGDARPDLTYSFGVSPIFETLHVRDTAMPPGAVGRYYSWGPGYSGGLGLRTITLSAGYTLPNGMYLNNSQIAGTPTAPGQYTVKIQGRDSANPPEVAERSFQFTVFPKMTLNTSTLPDAKVGVPYDSQISVSGGGNSVDVTLTPTSWPCCLYLREDGHIVGTPREAGTYSTWINARDEAGQWDSKHLTLNVTSDTLQMNTFALPAAKAGASYSATLNASGGAQPYTWRVADGSLPPGIVLDGAQLRGIPIKSGTYPFTVEVREPGTSGEVAGIGLSITVQ